MTNFDYALKQNDNGTFEVVHAATGESLKGQVETVLTSTAGMATVEVKLRLTGLRMYEPSQEITFQDITVNTGAADPDVSEALAATIRHFRQYNLR